jgi:hypothetical protein
MIQPKLQTIRKSLNHGSDRHHTLIPGERCDLEIEERPRYKLSSPGLSGGTHSVKVTIALTQPELGGPDQPGHDMEKCTLNAVI